MSHLGLTWDEIDALPHGTLLQEYISDTASGDDHWAVYRRTNDGKWELADVEPEARPIVQILELMAGGPHEMTTQEIREAMEEQERLGKKGTFTYSVVTHLSLDNAA